MNYGWLIIGLLHLVLAFGWSWWSSQHENPARRMSWLFAWAHGFLAVAYSLLATGLVA